MAPEDVFVSEGELKTLLWSQKEVHNAWSFVKTIISYMGKTSCKFLSAVLGECSEY